MRLLIAIAIIAALLALSRPPKLQSPYRSAEKQNVSAPRPQQLPTFRCALPVRKSAEKKTSRWGESLTEEKMTQCRWVTPKLVCQVAFVEWTDAGHLRHCSFVAMRDDKKPAEVVRET